jgi:predicted ribonuclease toxin of YeeF-YezG toxin-antitoxin module
VGLDGAAAGAAVGGSKGALVGGILGVVAYGAGQAVATAVEAGADQAISAAAAQGRTTGESARFAATAEWAAKSAMTLAMLAGARKAAVRWSGGKTTVPPAAPLKESSGLITDPFSQLARQYGRDIEVRSGILMTDAQRASLTKALREKNFEKLSGEQYKAHQKLFDQAKRDQLITEWEKNTGSQWPKYQQNILKKDGGILFRAGSNVQAHHIIHQSHGGLHEWWNIHPLEMVEHQTGVHLPGAPGQKIHGKK